uniref:Gonadotropin releasing hormone receptor 4 n=1 Tax=Sphaeramia orbicularis TaxID=375764 RepID=A0A673CIR6_9TELE
MRGVKGCSGGDVKYRARHRSHSGSALDPQSSCNKSADGDALQLPTFSTAAKVRVIITFTLCAVSAVCNLVVLWACQQRRQAQVTRQDPHNEPDRGGSAGDFHRDWQAGDFACRLLMFMKLVAMYSCAFVTVVISLDRQSAILNPLGIMWVLSLPQMFIFHNVTITVPENFTQCTTHGSFVQHWQETLYNMFTFVCLFLLPLAIMIFCYTRILIEISSRMLSRDVHLRRSHNNIPKARMRTLKMSIVIVTSFIICWTPYYLLGLWYWLFPEKMEETVSHSLTHMLFIFGLFNACLDPITYGLFTIHLHQGLKRCFRISNTQSDLENNTCLIHMTSLSSRRQKASGRPSANIEENNVNNSTPSGSRPVIPVSQI